MLRVTLGAVRKWYTLTEGGLGSNFGYSVECTGGDLAKLGRLKWTKKIIRERFFRKSRIIILHNYMLAREYCKKSLYILDSRTKILDLENDEILGLEDYSPVILENGGFLFSGSRVEKIV